MQKHTQSGTNTLYTIQITQNPEQIAKQTPVRRGNKHNHNIASSQSNQQPNKANMNKTLAD